MKNIILTEETGAGLSEAQLEAAIAESIADCAGSLKRVLMIVPDFTRYHSNAGFIANRYYHILKDTAEVDLLEALGTHVPVTKDECARMYGDIPFERFIPHNWRTDVVRLGEVPASFVTEVSGGLVNTAVEVELNRRIVEGGYDLILSIGQVVPHEVVGMANHSKNIFVGCGGASMINSSHMLGAFCGMEQAMGKDHSPVRRVFDRAAGDFLTGLPLCYVLTVTTAPIGNIRTHGLYIGRERKFFEMAVARSQKENLTLLRRLKPLRNKARKYSKPY